MNINELDSFSLADTVKFHDRLNPRLWDSSEHLRPEVHTKLMEIAKDFQEFLGVPDLDVKDITISGSNAAYNYTPTSDIDLHLVIDLPEADNSEVYRELFDAKKYQYNNQHNIKISGYDVELYVQNPNEEHHSQGIYSLLRNAWVSVPRRRKAEIDDISTKSKYEDLAARINDTISSGNKDSMASLMKKIKAMRQAGLEQQGEFGADNLAFKLLRNNGYIKRLIDARNAARDEELSLAEKARPKQRVTYGFMNESPDGVNPTTKMFLEEPGNEDEATVRDFIDFVAQKLGITSMPEIVLHTDPEWSQQSRSFGRYTPETHTLEVNLANRHVMDTLRTTAHELVHCRQNQESQLPSEAGETGSKWENQAHAIAGVIMRDYAEQNPTMFENASGYIPKNKKEVKDPRYSMAVTVDIKPGQVGKEANKLALNTGKNGEPTLLMKTANLQESLARELELFEEQDLFEVKMTSKNLSNLAKDIKGAKVGLEFEMIVPNVSNDDEYSNQEPDYDQDERVRDIDDAVNFFDDGDYNGRNEIRRLRERMESDYFDWQSEKIDERWYSAQGLEFFSEYLDRKDPFDDEEAEEEARNELQSQYGDEISTEDFEKMLVALVDEKRQNYAQEQWDEQGRNFDNAQEEFSDEQRDDVSESEWLDSLGIRYASDVQNAYSDVQWPYWSSNSDSEGDIENVALDFMNAMGMDTVAISSSYHGTYKKWAGNGWVMIGNNKPDDCFTIEPDGSLKGDNDSDTGLEFVSPPIPLEDIGTVMSKVQNWAGNYGAYTGDRNKTSIHTNISIPGYDLDKLDYLKAALLLGDEYVLREFDRIGNSYAAPAIEKVKQLVKQNPDKAKELLDKMKSQLNAEASKLIHSGQTNKFTSINTKDNRVEFRSPGGDYLSIISDNPQKMVDTINRMVVTLDAAMDPNKYKEEYQKKLYKVLTGQQSGREAASGAKREMKKDDKDLLNIFSRYAAGELPRAALKSFVRQAQFQRKVDAGKETGRMWWNVKYNGQRIEVVANSKTEAKQVAAKEWGLIGTINSTEMTAEPLRPYVDPTYNTPTGDAETDSLQRELGLQAPQNVPTLNGRPSNPDGRWVISPENDRSRVAYRFNAAAFDDANIVRRQWAADNEGVWIVQRDDNRTLGQPSQPATQQPAQPTQQGNWGIWVNVLGRFANEPGSYSRNETPPIKRFPSRAAAELWVEQQRAARPNMRSDIEVREIEPSTVTTQEPGGNGRPAYTMTRPAEPIAGSTLDLQRQRAAQQGVDTSVDYELYNRTTGEVIDTFQARNDDEARVRLDDFRNFSAQARQNPDLDVGVRRGPGVTNANNLRPTGPGPWEVANRNNNQVYYNPGHTQRAAAETEARTWLTLNGHNPADFEVRTREGVRNTDAEQGGLVDVAGEQPATAPQTLTRPGQGQQVFTGEWKVVDDIGQELYRFSGVGNAQADANRVAAQWIRQNPGVVYSGGISVLPVMG